jgi:hypothetical protein
MGFIQSPNAKVSLVAFLTQKGREYLVGGQPTDFRPRYFAAADPDTNYLQASQNTSRGANILPAGFVPDLSGDYTGAIHSLAGGVRQRSFLRGGSAIAQLGTNGSLGGSISTVGFGPSRYEATRVTALARPGLTLSIAVPLRLTSGAVIGGEQVRLTLAPPARGTSAALYPYLSFANAGIVSWNAGEVADKTALLTLSLPVLPVPTLSETAQGGYRYYVCVLATPYKASVLVPQETGLYVAEIFLNFAAETATLSGLSAA